MMRFDGLNARLRPILAAGAMVVLGACATAGGGAEPGASPQERASVVRVENDNWAQVNVYAIRDGLVMRLGTVPAVGRASFALPAMMRHANDVRLVVEPLASRDEYVSPAISWGTDVKLTVANQLPLSSVVPLQAGD